MIFSVFSRAYKPIIASLVLVSVSGCASYYSHFAMFPAENSSGEPRHVRLSWQSAEYPGWWFAGDKATPVKLETQCSDRVWRLRDDEEASACGEGIRACGEAGRDRVAQTGQPASGSTRCMSINPADPDARIAEIEGKLELLVSCTPAVVAEGEGDDALNLDYLRASSVPYTVYVRKAPRGSMRSRLPEFDESVCDAE
ncbi:hypothetical protein KZZ05_11085 [Marinobacter adhaerens]|jgi:hypothetical protein|uniref:Lipoprotein n=2 Tax=Marinobacter adhaerens TaxID=1033846 RepID=A0ABX8IBV4_9GAMM|nr:hypothetical protein [Marinobacter adhaerens]ADP97222.1 conserved hypothetical protein [Marinobacter adhaerens HP15]MBW4978817.1 hypothetical protein [Marinobacter adhaerens]QWV11322.1 hypothetical protein KQ249_11455 [Marinobacter adhaerens]